MTAIAHPAHFQNTAAFTASHTGVEAQILYVVRARFIGPAIRFIATDSLEMYFGRNGWQSLEDVDQFETRETAEIFADEIRRRVRRNSNRTVSVSVLPYVPVCLADSS